MIQDGALAPSLRGTGLRLSVVPGLDGVMDITIIADLVACGGTLRRKVMPLLLPRLGALSLWIVRVVAGVVSAASSHRWGMRVGVLPVGGGHCLGQPREHGTTLGCQTL